MPDVISLRFLGPSATPPDGESVIVVDLSGFPLLTGTVGLDAALLFLLLRAMRLRTGQVTLQALAWPLRTSERRIAAGIETLARAGLLTYTWERTRTGDGIVFEFPAQTPIHPPTTWPPSPARVHPLPTIAFVQALPLLGRDAFALYLALLAREPVRRARTDLRLSGVATSIGISGSRRQRRAVRRLVSGRVLEISKGAPFASATLHELPPPTRRERHLLRFLAIPFLPSALRGIAILAAAALASIALLLNLALHARHR